MIRRESDRAHEDHLCKCWPTAGGRLGGITVQTAIFNEPVAGPVAIRLLNLAGERRADLTAHGGSEKAVYVYAVVR